MVICPIARAVHCTGCPLLKFCPAKTILGDYNKSNDEPNRLSEQHDESAKEVDDSNDTK